MALIYSRSDVYVEERDFSQVVTSVPTSTGAIVYAAKRGRLERQQFTQPAEWISFVGKPNAAMSMAPYCALAFLNAGAPLWGKRAVGAGYSFGAVALQQKGLAITGLVGGTSADPRPLDVGGKGVDWATVAGATDVSDNLALFYADGPGAYSASLAIEVVSDNMPVPTGVHAADASTVGPIIVGIDTAGNISAGTYSYRVTAVNNVGETLASTAATVTITASGTSVYVSWPKVQGAKGYRIYGRTGGSEQLIAQVGGGTLYYIDYGTVTPAGALPTTQAFTSQFKVRVYDDEVSAASPVEEFMCSLIEEQDGRGVQLELEQAINGLSNYIRVENNAAARLELPPVYSIAKTYMSAGSDGAAVTDSGVAAAWDDFKETDQVDIRIMINGGYSSPTVQIKMNEVAKYRGDAVAILDLPSDKQKLQLALDYRNLTLNINSNRCALYGPDVYINDQYNGKKLFVPPSGHVAAQLVYTDKTMYPWFATAGLRRGLLDVLGVRYKYGKIERDQLHDAQVNYIRNLPGLGIAIWEQRTMQGTLSALSFLCVRRLFDNLELTIARAQQISLFEPNDDFTKLQVKTMCDQYLELVRRARGINKYRTVCDNRDNPALLSANGQLRADVFVEPTLPAEKIVLRFNITQQGVDFQELIAAGALN